MAELRIVYLCIESPFNAYNEDGAILLLLTDCIADSTAFLPTFVKTPPFPPSFRALPTQTQTPSPRKRDKKSLDLNSYSPKKEEGRGEAHISDNVPSTP